MRVRIELKRENGEKEKFKNQLEAFLVMDDLNSILSFFVVVFVLFRIYLELLAQLTDRPLSLLLNLRKDEPN